MKKDCSKCDKPFETTGETVKFCPACMKDYRRSKGLLKPEGWERKTEDVSAYLRAWRSANKEKIKGYESRRAKRTPEQERAKYVAKMKKIHGEDWIPRAERPKTPVDKDREKAVQTYKTAKKRGKLVKTACQVCGAVEVEGHHPDYSRPLDVVWLCREHHMEIHNSV